MSYILDALRKAEMERELSRVPGISSRQQLARAVGLLPGRYWLIVVAALVLGMSIPWLWHRSGTAFQAQLPVAVAAAADAAQGAEAGVVEPAGMERRMPAPAPAAVQAEPLVTARKSVPVIPEPEPAPAVQAEVAGSVEAPEAVQRSKQDHAVATDSGAPAVPSPEESWSRQQRGVDSVVAMIAAEAERGWPVSADDDSPPAPPAPVPDAGSTDISKDRGMEDESLPPLLRTLPYRFQTTLPKIVINAQAYADAVDDRFVIINMKKYRQAERTQDGIEIESIGKGYLLLSYQGQRFRLQR